jgi:hypothetical protein
MEMVIYVTAELASSVKPWAGANEDAVGKPLRTVVAGGSTGIRSDIIIAIRAIRGYSDVDAHLSLSSGSGSREADPGSRGQQYKSTYTH